MNPSDGPEPILDSDESDRESSLLLVEARNRSQQILEALIEKDIIKLTPEDKRRISVGLQGSVVERTLPARLEYAAANLDQHLVPLWEQSYISRLDREIEFYEQSHDPQALVRVAQEIVLQQRTVGQLTSLKGYEIHCTDNAAAAWPDLVQGNINQRRQRAETLLNARVNSLLKDIEMAAPEQRKKQLEDAAPYFQWQGGYSKALSDAGIITDDEAMERFNDLSKVQVVSPSTKNKFADLFHQEQPYLDLVRKGLWGDRAKEHLKLEGAATGAWAAWGIVHYSEISAEQMTLSLPWSAVAGLAIASTLYVVGTRIGGIGSDLIEEAVQKRDNQKTREAYQRLLMNLEPALVRTAENLQAEVKQRVLRFLQEGREGEFISSYSLRKRVFPGMSEHGNPEDIRGIIYHAAQELAREGYQVEIQQENKLSINGPNGYRLMPKKEPVVPASVEA